MKKCNFSYLFFLAIGLVISPCKGFTDITFDSQVSEEIHNMDHLWVSIHCPCDYMTPGEVADSVSQHPIAIKSAKPEEVKKKILNKKKSWDKLITITGDIDKDYDSVVKVLENSKDTKWFKWYLITNLKCLPEWEPVVIRSDYVTKIKGYKVRTVFATYIDTKEAFIQDAWVVSE